MKNLSILSAKALGLVGNALGRGSSLPGKVALSIDKDILKKLKIKKTVMVTGTNGKTSTSHFIAKILGEEMDLIHNAEGANMPQGIASVLLKEVKMNGSLDKDLAVLEVDEGFLRLITEDMVLDYLVLTNISMDQVDRFTSLDMTVDLIKKGIRPGTKLVLNGNDPWLVYLGQSLANEKIYYGLDLGEGLASFTCPSCGKDLVYSKGYYGNVGLFECECGLKTPHIDYLAENIDLDQGTFEVAGFSFKTPYKQDYMVYNLMAAISLAKDMGLKDETIARAIEGFEIKGSRMEKISFGGQETLINLVKNPAGLSRTLDFIARDQAPYNIYFALNKRPADGEDLSWLESVDFSPVKPEKLIIGGEAREEAVEILEAKGLEIDQGDLEDLSRDKNKTYILTNYTAMARTRSQIEDLK